MDYFTSSIHRTSHNNIIITLLLAKNHRENIMMRIATRVSYCRVITLENGLQALLIADQGLSGKEASSASEEEKPSDVSDKDDDGDDDDDDDDDEEDEECFVSQ